LYQSLFLSLFDSRLCLHVFLPLSTFYPPLRRHFIYFPLLACPYSTPSPLLSFPPLFEEEAGFSPNKEALPLGLHKLTPPPFSLTRIFFPPLLPCSLTPCARACSDNLNGPSFPFLSRQIFTLEIRSGSGAQWKLFPLLSPSAPPPNVSSP